MDSGPIARPYEKPYKHIVYFDESGNSGNNLNDAEQPIFVLGGLWRKISDLAACRGVDTSDPAKSESVRGRKPRTVVPTLAAIALINPEPDRTRLISRIKLHSLLGALIVPESCWQEVEIDLEAALAAHFPENAAAGEEIHSGDLRGSRGRFKGVTVVERVALRDAWLKVAHKHSLKFAYRPIEKKRYQKWMHETFGVGISINPHVATFPLVAMLVNRYLASQQARGMFISDENKEIVRDVEKSIRQLRLSAGPLRLSQIIEKGFFIDSAKSRILQLCDLCVLHARKKEEIAGGAAIKPFDAEGIKLIEPLILRGNEMI